MKVMAHEVGGRADKNGNNYEVRYVIYQLLQIIEEKVQSIVIEAIGEDEEGIDLWVSNFDGSREAIQCKSRNGSFEYWRFSDIDNKGIFNHWKRHLDRSKSTNVSLVSPLAFSMLEDLRKRAKNSSELPFEFYKTQILGSGKETRDFFKKLCKTWQLDPKKEEDLIIIKDYISRMHYRQVPDEQNLELIKGKISLLFVTDPQTIYDGLISLIMNGDILAKNITISYLNDYIYNNKWELRSLAKDSRILPRVSELNRHYRNSFIPIKGNLIHREEFDVCKENILNGQSMIIHGKAGFGKSGCTEYIIDTCINEGFPYLAIKLDKYTPMSSSYQWGKDLQLPESISYSLDSISKNERAVLILDQLDALRWTHTHAMNSITVCSEIIREVNDINKERLHPISIVFVCRTFDLENDITISRLFENNQRGSNIIWKKVSVGKLKESDIKSILGKQFNGFTKKTIELLQVPSNLYIWSKLKTKYDNEYLSTHKLVSEWWRQSKLEFSKSGNDDSKLQIIIESMIGNINKNSRMYVNKRILNDSQVAIDFLISCGFLIEEDNKISFSHQSLLDYFISDHMYNQFSEGLDIEEILGNKESQTPGKRYQLQMLLETILEDDEVDFIKIGEDLMTSTSVRYYNKFVFFELLGQIDNIGPVVEHFLVNNVLKDNWSSYLINYVVKGNKSAYNVLRKNGIIQQLLETNFELVIEIIISIKPYYDIDEVKIIEEYAQRDNLDIHILTRLLLHDFTEDSEYMFNLRLEIYDRFPEMMNSIVIYENMFRKDIIRAVSVLDLMLKHYEKLSLSRQSFFDYNVDFVLEDTRFIEESENVIKRLINHVPREKESTMEYSNWSSYFSHRTLERLCVDILKKANRIVITNDAMIFKNHYQPYYAKGYVVFNELILDGFSFFPLSESDEIVEYISDNLDNNIVVKTCGYQDELKTTKRCLLKHASECSNNAFSKLEDNIFNFLPSDAIATYKERIKYNNTNNMKVYWPFYGELQYELLNVLPIDRLRDETKKLIFVLNRRFKNTQTSYYKPLSRWGSVKSPVTDKNIYPTRWLNIITNKKLKRRKDIRYNNDFDGFIDSSLEQFSRDFKNEVSSKPLEYLELFMKNYNIIEPYFIDAFFEGLAYSEYLLETDHEIIEDLVLKIPIDYNSYASNFICMIIKKMSKFQWKQEILDLIKNIVLNYNDPDKSKSTGVITTDSESLTYEKMYINLINSVKGNASQAIGNLLWENASLLDQFKTIASELSKDGNPVVRLSTMFILLPSFKIDEEWATKILIDLLKEDHRILGFQYFRDILHIIYENNSVFVLDLIMKSFNSEDNDLKRFGSRCLSEFHILYNVFDDVISNVDKMDEMQIEEILNMAVIYFNKDEYNKKIKKTLLNISQPKHETSINISLLFDGNLINLDRDHDFLVSIIELGITAQSANAFVTFVFKTKETIYQCKDSIILLSETLLENLKDKTQTSYIDEDILGRLIIRLYDESTRGSFQTPQMKELEIISLDIWDKLFEYQVNSIREISKDMLER